MSSFSLKIAAFGIVAGLLGPGVPPALARTSHSDRPCGHVTFDYDLTRVQQGGLLDMDLSIENCSSRPVRFRLHVHSSGPCAFPHPIAHTYELPGHFGVSSSSLILAPPCSGRYSVQVKLTLARGRAALDTDGDGFSVIR
jgi:hypothetical protein